ncbi:MAG: DUF4836 family protein [Prevotella sp.]|nr:DUF4836 family protein [Prevotella sp.]
MNIRAFKSIVLFVSFVLVLTACSKTDYIDVIPTNSTALLAVDPAGAGSSRGKALVGSLLFAVNADRSGIDLSQRLYFFETADGNLGVCASVSSVADLTETFAKLEKAGRGKAVSERDGLHFSVLGGSWVAAFNDVALLVMGPVAVADQPQVQNRLARYLQQSEERSIRNTPMFAKLDSMTAPMTLVAQASALPEKLALPLTLGAPRNADASQVLLAAEMKVEKGALSVEGEVLSVEGEVFSFNKSIDRALKEAAECYRPIRGRFLETMPSDAQSGLFLNVDGRRLLPLMQGNAGMQALLAGVNAAIDMDNILKSVDGDVAVVARNTHSQPSATQPSSSASHHTFVAELAHSEWLADVGYWKQSSPKGSRIDDWGRNAYAFTDGNTSFCFGVASLPAAEKASSDSSSSLLFYSGTTRDAAQSSLQRAANPISWQLKQRIQGQRLVLLANVGTLLPQDEGDGALSSLAPFLRSLLGDVQTIVYNMK